jgi:hypothetical protein
MYPTAVIQAVSGFTATGTQIDRAVANIVAVSDVNAVGRKTHGANATDCSSIRL